MAKYDNCVFEGGGVKGLAFVGAIQALEEEGCFDFERYCGTSAGAITAFLLALGYTPLEVKDIFFKLDLNKFRDKQNYFTSAKNLVFNCGLYSGKYFEVWMQSLLEEKTGDKNASFKRVHSITGKSLTVIVSNLSTEYSEALGTETTPDIAVWKAVRASMAIPYYFMPIKMDFPCRSTKDSRNISMKECTFVDGGLFQNYPITYYDDPRYTTPSENGTYFNLKTIGLKLDGSSRIDVIKNHATPEGKKVKNVIEYTNKVINSMLNVMDNFYRSSDDNLRTVFIDSLGINTTQFDLSNEQKMSLFNSGYKSTKEFLKSRI